MSPISGGSMVNRGALENMTLVVEGREAVRL